MPENPESSGTWKKLLFIVINLFVVFWLGLILDGFWRVLEGEDPLLLAGILLANGAFLVAGVGLLILHRFYPVILVNRLLPFVAFILITVATLLNVTDTTLWFGLISSGVLIAATVITTIMNLVTAQAKS